MNKAAALCVGAQRGVHGRDGRLHAREARTQHVLLAVPAGLVHVDAAAPPVPRSLRHGDVDPIRGHGAQPGGEQSADPVEHRGRPHLDQSAPPL